MPELGFCLEGAEPLLFAAEPQLLFKLRISNHPEDEVLHSLVLRCQIRLEPTRRSYLPEEKEKLRDLFGEPARWGQTVRSMLWTHTSLLVPGFQGSAVVNLPVPCTFDFNVAATKYFGALEGDVVPLRFLFSGTIFHQTEEGTLQVARVSWEKEAPFALPVRTWREMRDHYYPNSAWLCLHRDTFEELARYKTDQGLPTWEQAFEHLLNSARRARS